MRAHAGNHTVVKTGQIVPRIVAQAIGVMLFLMAGSAIAAQHKPGATAPPADAPTPAPTVIMVDVGTQKVLRQPRPVRRVAIGEPKIADVNVINSRELLLNGKSLGSTSLLVWGSDPNAAPTEYRIQVSFSSSPITDPDLSKAVINPGAGIGGTTPNLLAHRSAELAATPPYGAHSGSFGDAGGGGGAVNTASQVIDRSQVALDNQVLSQIKIVEVSRTSLQEYGINFAHLGNSAAQSATTPTSINGVTSLSKTAGAIASATGFLPISAAFNFIYANKGYLGVLSVLENRNLARTLAEPSLTAESGQTATFLAGGEFPVPVPQSGGGTTPTITIQYKEFGVRLNLTPTVLANNRIFLKIAPEVSELDYTNGITIDGFTVPGLIVRRTDTSVELGDGESFVISGLVSDNEKNNVNKVPWLGDLPFIGTFFRNTSISRTDKELIFVVTPHLVHPIRRDSQLPPLPGKSIEEYRPNFAQTMFLETGKFGQTDESGYSR